MGKQVSCFICRLAWVLDWRRCFCSCCSCFLSTLCHTTIFVPTVSFRLLLANAKAGQYATNGSKDIAETVAWENRGSVWVRMMYFINMTLPASSWFNIRRRIIVYFIYFIFGDFCFLHKSIHNIWCLFKTVFCLKQSKNYFKSLSQFKMEYFYLTEVGS